MILVEVGLGWTSTLRAHHLQTNSVCHRHAHSGPNTYALGQKGAHTKYGKGQGHPTACK